MDQGRIWDHYQAGGETSEAAFGAAMPRYWFIAKRILREATVLNVGVGHGGLEELLIARKCEVFSLDPGERAIEAIRGRLALGERAQVGRCEEMPFTDQSFDVVIMSEVLEHLEDDVIARTLSEVKRVLRPGGMFVGTVPAEEDLRLNECVCPCCGAIFHRYGHVQYFDRARLGTLLGARFLRVNVSRHYFQDFARVNWRGRIAAIAKQMSLRLGANGSRETYYFQATD